jgi:uncharacterized cupredoxin-like copper-binding protein
MLFVFLTCSCVAVVSVLQGAVAGAAPVGSRARLITVINVTAGKPSELAFTLSKKSVPAIGTVTFKVTNAGKLVHDFKVCTKPVPNAPANACVGKVTKMLKPGQSTSLTFAFTKKGSFEYLCTLPGHASAGMKGLFAVATKAPPPSTTPPATTTTPATTPPPATKPPATESLIGDPVDGASVWSSSGCASCHTMRAAGASGLIGPDLDSIAAQLTQALVVTQVTNGGMTMPAFGSSLSSAQINDVASFVYKSTHA